MNTVLLSVPFLACVIVIFWLTAKSRSKSKIQFGGIEFAESELRKTWIRNASQVYEPEALSFEDVIALSARVHREGFIELAELLSRFANSRIGMRILSNPTGMIGCGKTATLAPLLIEGTGYVMACHQLNRVQTITFAEAEKAMAVLAVFEDGARNFLEDMGEEPRSSEL